MRRTLVITLFTLALAMPITAQTTWGLRTAIGAEKKITKGFDAGVEFKYQGHLIPLHVDDEISSLSAILLNDAYYELLHQVHYPYHF